MRAKVMVGRPKHDLHSVKAQQKFQRAKGYGPCAPSSPGAPQTPEGAAKNHARSCARRPLFRIPPVNVGGEEGRVRRDRSNIQAYLICSLVSIHLRQGFDGQVARIGAEKRFSRERVLL
jgi:hypothetical protein